MTEGNLLRLTRSIVLLSRRAKQTQNWRLLRALDDAAYYAGLQLGELIVQKRERVVDGEGRKSDEL